MVGHNVPNIILRAVVEPAVCSCLKDSLVHWSDMMGRGISTATLRQAKRGGKSPWENALTTDVCVFGINRFAQGQLLCIGERDQFLVSVSKLAGMNAEISEQTGCTSIGSSQRTICAYFTPATPPPGLPQKTGLPDDSSLPSPCHVLK